MIGEKIAATGREELAGGDAMQAGTEEGAEAMVLLPEVERLLEVELERTPVEAIS